MATVDTLPRIQDINLSNSESISEDGQATPHPRCPASGSLADSEDAVCPVTGASAPPPDLNPSTQEVDPELLRTSIAARMTYLKDFLGFKRYDQEILSKVAPLVYESIPPVVDRLYAKLFEFDVTKQVRVLPLPI